MPSEDLALVREMWDAFARSGVEGVLPYAAADAEWHPWSAGGRAFDNTADYARHMRELDERGDHVVAKIYDVVEEGGVVLAAGSMRLIRPEGFSEAQVHWVHRIRDGKIVYTAAFPSRDDARRAAGLAPE